VTGLTLGLSQCCFAKKESGKKFFKAVIVEKPTEESLTPIKDAGFDGVEAGIVGPGQAERARLTAEKLGLRIHSVMRGWAKFNSDKQEHLESSIDVTVDALYAAQAYGADAVLLVPGRTDVKPMPQPWEFRITFDPKTGHLTQVVPADNDRYRDYIAAHDHAYDAFQAAIRRLIPIAEKTGVVIAVENVWNNLFVDPRHFAHLIDSFQSPWVRAYFDIGNHVKYSPPQKWIPVLGKRIAKCHVKDFKLNPDGKGGKFVNIREGSVNWPVVIDALTQIGYRGWLTIEGSRELAMDEQSRRLDLIIAGR
jgi:hexulose-6-phosphate isomerase